MAMLAVLSIAFGDAELVVAKELTHKEIMLDGKCEPNDGRFSVNSEWSSLDDPYTGTPHGCATGFSCSPRNVILSKGEWLSSLFAYLNRFLRIFRIGVARRLFGL